MEHSKRLEDTELWKAYNSKNISDKRRNVWIREVYDTAIKSLLDVRLTFRNYTLHDETHILNVLDAMGGILGDQIEYLTISELEMLILVSCLHDLGMVYSSEEKQRWFKETNVYNKFLREYCPELIGLTPEEWPEDKQQWFLRMLHPFRLAEVLQNNVWNELFGRCPHEIVPKRCILAVCQAHGQEPQELLNNIDLEYLPANNTSPLFCALLLRLCDLLDFDDTRAPKVLYEYVVCNEKSRKEWDKHQESAGFNYPISPSIDGLPYKARCTNPSIEHAIRDFLDWIDDELANCNKLQKYCVIKWQQDFPFPRRILRNEIESDGYMSGDFCLTLNQEQTLNMLSGKNLYDNIDVFVRELLQNAIDAMLLRSKMDSRFIPEESRIDLWEWCDKNGDIWFRIDDRGVGMTLGMLQRYFLKVGNSYYVSAELEKDLLNYGQETEYHGISQFGIGFLSTFLCGDYAEISTLFCIPEKNIEEEDIMRTHCMLQYGLRLQMTGLTGYYTLKSQIKQHSVEQMPSPENFDSNILSDLERNGYRSVPGTSIAIRLNPGRLGAIDLRKAAEKYICVPQIPVYYNNKRIGQTYQEFNQVIHELPEKYVYELPIEIKVLYDKFFPALSGNYPKIVKKMVSLDSEENRVLPDLTGVLIMFDIHYDNKPKWKIKDQTFEIHWQIQEVKGELKLNLQSANSNRFYARLWHFLMDKYESEQVTALEREFEKYSICPSNDKQLGEVWLPFKDNLGLQEAWISYYDSKNIKELEFSIVKYIPEIWKKLPFVKQFGNITFSYNGILAGSSERVCDLNGCILPFFILENKWRPIIEISRSKILKLPLEVLVATYGILVKYSLNKAFDNRFYNWNESRIFWKSSEEDDISSLLEWRKITNSQLGIWMKTNLNGFFEKRKQRLQEPEMTSGEQYYNNTICNFISTEGVHHEIVYEFLMAELQVNYSMTINYEKGQVILFYEKDKAERDEAFDLFPPMMFCKAASKQSRQYICAADAAFRKCITMDHPFIIWLLENSNKLVRYYPRQFQQIVNCLCRNNANFIVKQCNYIREQLIKLPEHHGIDIDSLPQISLNDFWVITKTYEDFILKL